MKGEIKQRSPGSWEIRVFLGRDENGKRSARTRPSGGRKPTRSGGFAKFSQR